MMNLRRLIRHYRHKLNGFPGYNEDLWSRIVYLDKWTEALRTLGTADRDLLEISPGSVTRWFDLGFRSYRSVQYPDFDITREALPEKFDVIIAEHVFEHLRHPYAAARHVRRMLRDDGVFLIATPFMIRIHREPHDYTRWTPEGLQGFLEDCGFDATVSAWGNAPAVRANLPRWAEYGWGITRTLRNEPDFPLVVWAIARPRRAP